VSRRSSKLIKITTAAAAAAILAVGAYMIATSQTDTASGTQSASGQVPGSRPGQAGAQSGAAPGRGMGDPVTGAVAQKVAKAATARYPGDIERIEQMPDGTYVAHVVTGQGELHVTVSRSLRVLGTEQRPQGAPPGTTPGQGAPSQGGAAPAPGTATPSASSTTS